MVNRTIKKEFHDEGQALNLDGNLSLCTAETSNESHIHIVLISVWLVQI